MASERRRLGDEGGGSGRWTEDDGHDGAFGRLVAATRFSVTSGMPMENVQAALPDVDRHAAFDRWLVSRAPDTEG